MSIYLCKDSLWAIILLFPFAFISHLKYGLYPFPNIHWASYSHSCAIVFSLVPECEVLLFKTNEKATTHCTNGLKKYYFLEKGFFFKCCWSVKKVDNLSVINIRWESDRKSAAYSKIWRFLLCFLSCQWIMLYWSYV